MNLQDEILLNIQIGNLSYEGLGTYRDEDNFPYFIENALPGEIVDIQIKKKNSRFAFCKVLKYHKFSAQRNFNTNDKLMKSGSAPIAMLNYDDQLKFKQDYVEFLFKRNIHFSDIKNILKNPNPWEYRNKLTVFVKSTGNKIVLGLYEKNTHNIIEQDNYDLALKPIQSIFEWISKNINNYELIKKQVTFIESITIRHSNFSNQSLVIINSTNLIDIPQDFINDLINNNLSVVNIIQNTKNHSKISDKKYLKKPAFIIDKIGEFEYKINWNSFFQVNNYQVNNLYNLLLNNLGLKSSDVVVDAYCGIGSISLKLAKASKFVYGLEIIKEAVDNAIENAKLNMVDNVKFICGDVNKTIKNINDNVDVIVVDPPRSGISDNFMKSIIEIKPKTIGYISCDVKTMCRDIAILMEEGYQLNFLQPCDMFSQTHHIECVGILSKVNK